MLTQSRLTISYGTLGDNRMNNRSFPWLACLPGLVVFALITVAGQSAVNAQNVSAVAQSTVSGKIVSIKPGEVSIKLKDGTTASFKIQNKDEQAISIGGNPIRIPAKISVTGSIPIKLIEKGMIVKFSGRCNVYGKPDGELKTLKVLASDSSEELNVEFLERPEGRDPANVDVVARALNHGGKKLLLQVPKAKWAKKERITFVCAEDCVLKIEDDDLNRVKPGDLATNVRVLELSTGDRAITEISIFLAAERDEVTTSYHDKLAQQFSLDSDEPGEPRELRSDHFVLYTDLSDQSAKILLAKLETMYRLVGGYYGARPSDIIECYVVRDLRKWPPGKLDPKGVAKIAEPAGVTLTVPFSNGKTKASVYSCDKHSVVQHEAVHAFCAQTFGSTGPVWYSEGMAEMGQYWIPGERAVNIDPVVIDYLTNSEQKKMADIVAAGQITGDSWQAYAWRWALCHLLANNPNYAKRFKKLGLNLMTQRPDSFEAAFGNVANQISYEYDEFVKNFGNGYRVDLCTWDWKTKCSNLSSNGRVKQIVKAQRGWQGTKLKTKAGVSYDFVAQGNWKINAIGETTADGVENGDGKLVGMIFQDGFEQSEPFELGKKGSFIAETEGQLYVRCRESWTNLADNDDAVTLHIRRSPKEAQPNKNQ